MPIAVYLNWRSLLIIILKFKISFQLAYGKQALLNINKTNFIIFPPSQKPTNHMVKIVFLTGDKTRKVY